MKAHIITIGNEILNGDIINTNSTWLGEKLTLAGFSVHGISSVGDVLSDILDLFSRIEPICDLIIVTGGLGPTHDDITKKVLQSYFNVGLRRDSDVLNFIQAYFNKRGIPFSESNYQQADVLENCEVLFNYWGSAPGMLISKSNTQWIILPGVPTEMKNLFSSWLKEKRDKAFPVKNHIKSTYLSVAGIGESTLSDTKLMSIQELLDDSTTLAYLPHHDGITLRLTSSGENEQLVSDKLSQIKSNIISLAGDYIYSETQESLAASVGKLLNQRGYSIATAESCTGGGIAHELTHTAGCSSYMMGGIIAYSNDVKTQHLKVPEKTIEQYGAVSAQTAIEMAKGVRSLFHVDCGISVTGIAGPGGGTDEKPVGLIWFGISTPNTTFAFKAM